MNRFAWRQVALLTFFLLRDFFRSLAGAVPPALTLSLYAITFTYPATVDYFTAVAGAALLVVAFVSTWLLAWRVNRALSYPWLVHLPQRWPMLAAVAWTAMLVTLGQAALFTILALVQDKLTLTGLLALQIAARWFCLFVLAIALALLSSKMTSRHGSYLAPLLAMALLLTTDEWRGILVRNNLHWPVQAADLLLGPLRILLLTDPRTLSPATTAALSGAALVILGTASLLSLLAISLFAHKDLVWVE